MARRGGLDLNDLILIGGVGFLAAWFGLLGGDLKCKLKRAAGAPDPSCGLVGGGTGGSTGGTGGGGGGGGGCLMSSPGADANPNYKRQVYEWQTARRSLGQDPYDWNEFREHLKRLGAPDPGPTPVYPFCGG